ncbi:uncharacterized protein LOC131628527 [Vicia villosa]|uniref:uncharacterized protein LOC131628527 n=1 Tax=Vicia villosa TaxID=3911 RepID=UPI00273A8945|nr:uncharacterized protein LOC131628527 [Vicia villosa]
MLVASVHFWDASHNTFHLPCGMVTPTLFYIAAITGLRPTGETFDPNVMDTDTINFSEAIVTYTAFIQQYHDENNEVVSDEEHIAFLALWLSRCVFCSRSIQVAKRYLCMANQLHAGTQLNLSQLILGFLYENLGEATDLIKSYESGSLLFAGPFWFLQLWLNATFEAHLPFRGTVNEEDPNIKSRAVEGTRLALLTPKEETGKLHEHFLAYVMMFAQCYQFSPSMAPFVQRTVGPEWFTRRFPAMSPNQQTESVIIWEAFLTPRLFYHRLRPSKGQCVLLCYQPNLVSRQFGLVQIKPKCLYEKRNHMCLHTLYLAEDECESKIARYTGVTNLSPVPFEPAFYSTPDFQQWWTDYYTMQIFDAESLTRELTEAFADVQENFRKGTSTHIKEIQAFQKFFETIYRPDDLSRTVREAAVILREKFSAKLDKLKLPSSVRPELRYEVAFKLNPPKFPPLPSADFGVALSPPFPDWFVCGNAFKILQESTKKRAERVVPTKHTLDTFKGHLHIDLEHVRVLTPIPEGLGLDNFRLTFLFFSAEILIPVSTTGVARKRKIKEAAVQKDSGVSKSNKTSRSDSTTTGKKPTTSKPPVHSKRKDSQTAVLDDEDKSPPRTRQGHKKRQKTVTPSGKEKGSGSSKITSPADKVSSEESPLKGGSNVLVVESHNSSPDNIPTKVFGFHNIIISINFNLNNLS